MRYLVPALVMAAACGFRPAATSDGNAVHLDVVFMDTPTPLDGAPADWWDPNFRWRFPIAISNGSTSALPVGFQAGLRFDLDAAPCNGVRDAVRITWRKVELDRYVDELGATDEWIWFATKAAIGVGGTSTDYWLYCANGSPAAAPQDPASIFAFFDNFNGSALSGAWQSKNTVTIAGGNATIGGGGLVDSGILTTATWSPGTAVDYTVSIATPANADFWAGFQIGFPDAPPWIQWWSQSPPSIRPDYASTATDASQFLGTNVALDTSARLFGVEYYGTASMYRYQDAIAEHHTHGTAANPAALNIRLHNHSSTTAVQYGMVRARRAIDPPPVVTVGAAETY